MCRIPGKEWGFSEKGPTMPDGFPQGLKWVKHRGILLKWIKKYKINYCIMNRNNGNERDPLNSENF